MQKAGMSYRSTFSPCSFPTIVCLFGVGTLLFLAAVNAAQPLEPSDEIRAAIARALPAIEKSSAEFRHQRVCFSCHHQALPLFALHAAQRSGFRVDENNLKNLIGFTMDFLDRGREKYQIGIGQGGEVTTAGYALWTLEAGNFKPNETTSAIAEYLLIHNRDRDHWKPTALRPPSEGSNFTSTYVAIRGLKSFATSEQKERMESRIRQVREWLVNTPALDTEDHVFRLRSLQLAGASDEDVRTATRELVEMQRADGGWSQKSNMSSDAYATGSALVALHESGVVSVTDAVYQKGLQFLLENQRSDGTWLVQTRSDPIQTYFESGFPYGKDQFISIAGTCWAVIALAAGLS